MIKETASLNLLPSEDVLGHTFTREHEKHQYFKCVTVAVFNKYRHAAKVQPLKKIITTTAAILMLKLISLWMYKFQVEVKENVRIWQSQAKKF